MASILKLVRGTTELSLLARPGLCLADEAWQAGVAESTPGRIPPYIVESMPVRVTAASQDAMAATMQALHAMAEGAARYWSDRTELTPVWLHAKLVEETGERRALVRNIQFRFADDWYGEEARGCDLAGTLVIERHPYWEATSDDKMPYATPAAAVAVMYDYISDSTPFSAGDVPARIEEMEINVPAKGSALDRFWIGFRSASKHWGLELFKPVWECEDAGGFLYTDVALASDTTASPGGGNGSCVRITPGTATWAKRVGLAVGFMEGDRPPAALLGRFLWLLRARVSAGTWEVQLRFGAFSGSDDLFVRGPIVPISNTNWDIYEMGIGSLPGAPRSWPPLDLFSCEEWGVQIWARRTSGSGMLDLDCLCPLPIDEGYAIIKGASLGPLPEHYSGIILGTTPRDEPYAISENFSGGLLRSLPQYSMDSLGVPLGNGRMMIVYARATSSVLTDTIQIGHLEEGGLLPVVARVYPRWLSLRGAE